MFNYILYVYYVSIYWFLWTGNASTGAINISKTSVWNHLCSNTNLLKRVYLHIPKGWELIFHPTHCSKLSSLCQDVIQFKDREVQAAEIPKNLTDGLWKSIVICCVSVVARLASRSLAAFRHGAMRSPKSPQLRHRIITAWIVSQMAAISWLISLDISRNSPTLSFNL